MNLASFSEKAELKALKAYRFGFENDQEMNDESLQQMRWGELESFKGCPEYRRWIESPSASLLVISAYNHDSISDSNTFCWMSPLALDLIDRLRKKDHTVATDGDNESESESESDSDDVYAYQVIPQEGLNLYDDVLPKLLLQLLRRTPYVLKDKREYRELQAQLATFHSPPSETADPDDFKADIMKKIAMRIIKLFKEFETVYIIVDRVDRCNMVRPRKIDHRKALIRFLVELVQTARAKLRILAVVDGGSWQLPEDKDDLGIKMDDRVITHRVEQARVSDE